MKGTGKQSAEEESWKGENQKRGQGRHSDNLETKGPSGVPAYCPECGEKTKAGADICEHCGAWLLDGLCPFCYSAIEKNAVYCNECGNPVKGIACPECNKKSIFDFCPHCNIPLTPQATESLESLKLSFKKALSEMGHKDTVKPASKSDDGKAEANTKSGGFNWDGFMQKNLKKILEGNTREGSPEENGDKQGDMNEALFERALTELQQQSFPNQQAARRHYEALKLLLPTLSLVKVKKRIPVGWRCYAFNVVHPEGPHACAEPHKGGEWIFEVIEETQEQTRFDEHTL